MFIVHFVSNLLRSPLCESFSFTPHDKLLSPFYRQINKGFCQVSSQHCQKWLIGKPQRKFKPIQSQSPNLHATIGTNFSKVLTFVWFEHERSSLKLKVDYRQIPSTIQIFNVFCLNICVSMLKLKYSQQPKFKIELNWKKGPSVKLTPNPVEQWFSTALSCDPFIQFPMLWWTPKHKTIFIASSWP